MSNKFATYFRKSLLNEAMPAPAPMDDEAALKKSIENPVDAERLDNEIQDVGVGADQVNNEMSQLRETASNYSQEILEILNRVVAIHDDITSGPLAKLGIKVGSNTLTSIRGDLGKLAQIIGGGANDVIMKQETDKAKTQSKMA